MCRDESANCGNRLQAKPASLTLNPAEIRGHLENWFEHRFVCFETAHPTPALSGSLGVAKSQLLKHEYPGKI